MKPTPQELAYAADVTERDAALARWLGKRSSYRPEELPEWIHPPTNEERSRAECILFRAAKHEKWFGYLTRDDTGRYRITTFTGETLATVVTFRTRKVRGSWLTDERGSFWARGIDGRLYHGRHNGAGVYCRMRLAKKQ